MKPIAICFSDLHINIWAKFNDNKERTKNHFKVLSLLFREAHKYGCPILFTGDLFHKPEYISPELLNMWFKYTRRLSKKYKVKVYCISGNHDIRDTSKIPNKPLSWVNVLSNSNFICIDYEKVEIYKGITVYGIPYIDHNIGLNEYLKSLKLSGKNILLLHTDYPGAKDTDGRVIGSVENLNLNILSRFDLVLCGHIHKPQQLSKKVYMIGAPLQQRRTDRNCKLGRWYIYKDLTIKFKPYLNFPKFIDVNSSEEVLDDGNYYTVLPKKEALNTNKQVNTLSKTLSKRVMAKRYLKLKGIKDKDKKDLLTKLISKYE